MCWLAWHPCTDIRLWIKDADPSTTDEQRAEHKRVHFRRLNSKNDTGPDSSVKQTLNMYEEWCGDGGVRPLASMQEYEDFMVYVATHLKTLKSGEKKLASFRTCAERLAHFHGYPAVQYSLSMTLKVDLPRDLHSAVTSLKKHVSHNPINQEDSAFTVDEMKEFLSYVVDMPCSSNSASMLLYAGIAMQSLSRPGQLCEVRRANLSMYPNKQMHEVTDFGPIRMLGVSTVGFKQNEQAEVTHWIQRTNSPSCRIQFLPWQSRQQLMSSRPKLG